jgi:OOP family OmpA-OmpF porin
MTMTMRWMLTIALFACAATARAQNDLGFDFTPGKKVLLEADFARTPLGMFPRNLSLVSGNYEVAKFEGRTALRASSYPAVFTVPLPAILPERFTLEFDYWGAGWDDEIWLVPRDQEGFEHMTFSTTEGGLRGSERDVQSENGLTMDSTSWHHVALMVDGNYAKVYSHGVRVANVPNAMLGRSNRITFVLYAGKEKPGAIANLRIAAGGKDLTRALAEDGRITLEGLEFDTGSDKLRTSSDSLLATVATELKKAADLNVSIEGHTDNVGADAANLALSERRAKAVQAKLVALGVPAARLQAKGYGASQPIASNDTPDGRQRNRRVELVRTN